MRLAVSVALALAMTTSLIACTNDGSALVSSKPASTTSGVLPLADVDPSAAKDSIGVTPPPTTAAATASVAPTAAPTTLPSTTITAQIAEPIAAPASQDCDPPFGGLMTASGRRVVVRPGHLDQPSPAIVVMHGYSGTPETIEKFSELTDVANAAGVAVIYPQGTPTPAGGFGWNTGAGLFSTSESDDVEGLRELLDTAVATGCIDTARVVIAGESNGAAMALVALCDERLQHKFTAAVLVIPAVDDGVLAHCSATDAVPIGLSVVAGRLDGTVGYAVGRPPFPPAEQWFQTVAAVVNGCPTQTPQPTQVDALVDRIDMSGCAACTEMFAIADGTHTWPGSSRGTGGQTPGTFDLDQRLVDLALHPDDGCLV
jgi:polyhydroxybutyrate depolymerase